MNDQERWNYLTGLRSDELRLMANDQNVSKELREGAQTLLNAKNQPVWCPEHAEKSKSSPEG